MIETEGWGHAGHSQPHSYSCYSHRAIVSTVQLFCLHSSPLQTGTSRTTFLSTQYDEGTHHVLVGMCTLPMVSSWPATPLLWYSDSHNPPTHVMLYLLICHLYHNHHRSISSLWEGDKTTMEHLLREEMELGGSEDSLIFWTQNPVMAISKSVMHHLKKPRSRIVTRWWKSYLLLPDKNMS